MDVYKVGAKICLWQIVKNLTDVIVCKEVVVTVIGTKDSILRGELPQSLRALGAQGEEYKKFWDNATAKSTHDQLYAWSERDDGELPRKIWTPIEAVSIYNQYVSHFEGNTGWKILSRFGKEMIPKGDIVYCVEHDQYTPLGNECLMCTVRNLQGVL